MKSLTLTFLLTFSFSLSAQTDARIYDVIDAVSAERIEKDNRQLANFGTRHTMSETKSETQSDSNRSRPVAGIQGSASNGVVCLKE